MSQSLELVDIVKHYDRKQVLNGISFFADKGEFVVLVGPSGCGKSTVLRAISGLEPITSGSVRIGGKDVSNLKPKDRHVAMVFQDYALYPHKSVFENIAFGLRIRKFPEAEIVARVHAAAEKLDLMPYLQRKPAALSGGQRQRVAIGRTIVRQPHVFLFDEPLSNLDAKLRGSMRITLSKLHKELDATVVYVTHDQVEAMTLATRIIVLEAGRIQQSGTPLELYYHPSNKFVAEFIGSPSMNMISGHLKVIDGKLGFESDLGLRFAIPEALLVRLNDLAKEGKKVFWGVRPENFRVGADVGLQKFTGKILVTEPLGAQTNVVFDMMGHEMQICIPEPHRPKVGETMELAWQSKHIYMFDQETGLSLERKQ